MKKGKKKESGKRKRNIKKISVVIVVVLVVLFILALTYQGAIKEVGEEKGELRTVSLGGGVEKSVRYDLGPLIDQGMETDAEAIEQTEKEERESDPIYQIMLESLTEEDLEELEQGVEGIIEETEGEEISEEELARIEEFFPETAEPEKVKSIREIDKETEKREIEIEVSEEKGVKEIIKKKSFWRRFLKQLREEWRIMTGRVISEEIGEVERYEEGIEDLPPIPQDPGPPSQVVNPSKNNFKILSFLTGNAIIGVPDWSFDGSKTEEGNFLWKAKATSPAFSMQHFDLSLGADLSVEGVTNAVVYGEGYYLNTNEEKWKPFNFDGVKVGNTGWLRNEAKASITLEDVTTEDYSIFLAYSCLKVEGEWGCNEGKWIIFVVETGETYYHRDIGEAPPMEYTKIADLDVKDIPSILEQLGVSVEEFEPILHDIMIIAPQIEFEVEENNVQKLDFYVRNLGNRELTGLTFELDVGEQVLAEVVAADIPDAIGVGETVSASISLLLKERGSWKFPLFVNPPQEEVDTSDNLIMFDITVGEPITERYPTDPLDTPWNREIDYTIKEPFTITPYAEGSSLVVISGTDKVRTIFGGYYEGLPINPTMGVYLQPKITEEAIFSTPFIASINIGGRMLTGDREVVEFYVVITNENNGNKYTTPIMESQFGYYYNPKELIPDFEFCVDYTAEVILVGKTSETIDIIEPEGFNICEFNKFLSPFVTSRLLKLDGNYVTVSAGFSTKYFEDVNIQYKINFTDPKNPDIKYETPVLNSKDGFEIFKVEDFFKSRHIDYHTGEIFQGKVILIDNPQARGGAEIKFGEMDESLHFVWRGWDITAKLKTSLVLKDERVKIIPSSSIGASSQSRLKMYSQESKTYKEGTLPWTTTMRANYAYSFPIYYSSEVSNKIRSETSFIFLIKDLNENRFVYEFDGNCPRNCRITRLTGMNEVKPLPEFKNGHTYELSFKVLGKHAHLFIPVENMRIFYLDGFQFIVNNPLLRTRFIFLDNTPSSFSISGGISENYVPEIYMHYTKKNTHTDDSNYKFRKIDTSEREIKISELNTLGRISEQSHFTYDYELPVDGTRPPFSRLSIKIIPLKKEEIRYSKSSFNCKIGRFEAVCSRTSRGYNINYVDHLNDIFYQINLLENSNIFLKKYRDNPQLYDAIIYDVLKEMRRNPIVSFEIPYYVENNLKNIVEMVYIDQNTVYDPAMHREENRLKCLFDENHGKTFGDYKIYNSRSSFDLYKIKLEVFSIENSETVASKEFDDTIEGREWEAINEWITSLNLNNNKHYRIDVKAIDGGNYYFKKRYSQYFGDFSENPGIYYFSKPFKYKNHYEKEVIEDNADFIRKIPELKSTILGPYDFTGRCVDNLWKSRLGKPFGGAFYGFKTSQLSNGKLHVFPEVSYYNDPYGYFNLRFNRRRGDNKPNRFFGIFSVNPPEIENHYPGEETSLEEFRENTIGERRKNLESDRVYAFAVDEYDNIYDYYEDAPVNINTYDTGLSGIVCKSSRISFTGGASLYLTCSWSNIDDLKVYQLGISQYFPGKTNNDLYNLEDDSLNDFKSNYAEVVLAKYLDWYPPTPILNTNYYSYSG